MGKIPHNRKRVIAYKLNTDEVVGIYNSHAECAKFLNINKSHIHLVISGKRKQCGEFYFKND